MTPDFNLGRRQHFLLCEALRRFECFAVRNDKRKWTLSDLQAAWTGLGTATTYKPVVDAGFMKVATTPNPGFVTWWGLTEKGARIVLAWHKAGFTCGNGYELQKTPPAKLSDLKAPASISQHKLIES